VSRYWQFDFPRSRQIKGGKICGRPTIEIGMEQLRLDGKITLVGRSWVDTYNLVLN